MPNKKAPQKQSPASAKKSDKPAGGTVPRGVLSRHKELIDGATRHVVTNIHDPSRHSIIKRHEKAQNPDYFVLCCADSRYEPKDVFHMESGRFFTYRNAGNIMTGELNSSRFDPGMAGTLAYALQVLKIKHIIILGHTGCGLVKAVMDEARIQEKGGQSLPLHEFTRRWMTHAGQLKKQVDEHYDFDNVAEEDLAAVGEHVLRQVERVRSLEVVRQAFEDGTLHDVIGAVYEMQNQGNVSVWDDDQEKFVSISMARDTSLPERHSQRDD